MPQQCSKLCVHSLSLLRTCVQQLYRQSSVKNTIYQIIIFYCCYIEINITENRHFALAYLLGKTKLSFIRSTGLEPSMFVQLWYQSMCAYPVVLIYILFPNPNHFIIFMYHIFISKQLYILTSLHLIRPKSFI